MSPTPPTSAAATDGPSIVGDTQAQPVRFGSIGHLSRRVGEVMRDEGLRPLAAKTVRKLISALKNRLPVASDIPPAEAVAVPDPLFESVLSFAAAQRRKARRGECRSIVETRHFLREHCQSCLHFDGSVCSLSTLRGTRSSQRELVRSLVEPSGACPLGAWPPPAGRPITRMNLVYFIFPLKHPDNIWQWNVDQLLRRIAPFNGRKIVTVATGDGSLADRARIDPPEAVMEAFSRHEMEGPAIEFRFAPNNPACGEAEHFLPALRMLASTDPGEALFYAHAKGVTRPKSQLDVILRWTTEMYQHNLDRIDEVRELLPRWPCVGIAKSYGYPAAFRLPDPAQSGESGNVPFHGWHYAGTFWWVRHDALFSRPDWDQIEVFPHATERYLGNFFRSDEAICLAHDDMVQPYDMACWQRTAA